MTLHTDQAEFKQTTKNASVIGVSALAGALVGFVLQLLVAYYFGAGHDTDAYFMAQSTSELLSKLLLGGSIVSVFIPIFIERLQQQGKDQAWQLALNVMNVTAAAFLLLVVIIGFFAQPFVHFIAPGFDPEAKELTVALLRVLLPSFFFLFLVDLGTAMLQAIKHFTVPAALRVVAPTVSVVAVVALVSQFGIYSLAIGAVVGSIIQFSLIMIALGKQGFFYRFMFHPLDSSIKHLVHLVYPFLLSMAVTQAAGIVYRILVSDLPSGSLTALKFAEKITQLTTVIFLTSVTVAIYPLMAEKAARQDFVGLKNSLGAAIRLIFFVSLPIVIGVSLLREPLVSFLYQRGSFDEYAASQTAIALLYLTLGLTTNGISSVFGYATLALKKTRASVAVTVISQMIAIALFYLLVPVMAHAGLALASSLVPLAIGGLYMIYLSRFIPNILSIFRHVTYFKTIILSVALVLVITGLNKFLTPYVSSYILQLIIIGGLSGCLYFFAAYLWRIPEMRQASDIIMGRLAKLKRTV